VLSQLDFAIRIARGLSGLPMPLFGKRKVGRPEKVGEPAAKKKRAMAGKVVKSTPERRKQRDLERVAAYSSVKKKDRGAAGEGGGGGVASREYPNNRIEAGKGLPIERLDSNRGLQHHRPRDMRVNMMARENDHRCQVCAAVGPLWKRGTRFRGGTKKTPPCHSDVWTAGLLAQLLQRSVFQLVARRPRVRTDGHGAAERRKQRFG